MSSRPNLRYTGPKEDPSPSVVPMPRSEFAPLVDSLVDGVVVINHAGVIVRANPAVCEMFGYDETELLGENVALLMMPEDSQRHDEYLKKYAETGQGSIIGVGREVTGQHRDGQQIALDLSVTPATEIFGANIISPFKGGTGGRAATAYVRAGTWGEGVF